MAIGEFSVLCPHCDANLSVTEEGMYHHNGQVRCGKCRTMFYAPNSLLKGVFDESRIAATTTHGKLLTAYADGVVTEVLPSVGGVTLPAPSVTHTKEVERGGFYDDLAPFKDQLSQQQVDTNTEYVADINEKQRSHEPQDGSWTREQELKYQQMHQYHTRRRGTDRPDPAGHYRDEYERQQYQRAYAHATRARMKMNTIHAATPGQRYTHIEERAIGTTKWVVFSLFAVLVLLGQYLWIKLPTLYQYSALRPIYQAYCSVLPCDIGRFINLKQIDVAVSLINKGSSKTTYGTASFTGVIKNKAYIDQPFPALRVLFFDANRQVILEQTVQSVEYLVEKSLYVMPSSRPIEVAFTTPMPYNMRAYSVQVDDSP